VLFAILYRVTRRRPTAIAASAWLCYTIYEYAMYRRWLCSGECNIRVDLLVIYPVLIVMTIVGCVAGVRGLLRRPRHPTADGGGA
jgi:hypothetical protein